MRTINTMKMLENEANNMNKQFIKYLIRILDYLQMSTLFLIKTCCLNYWLFDLISDNLD